jgi:translation initiation factor 4E
MAEVAPATVGGSLSSPEVNNENGSGLDSTNGENITVFHDPENFNVKHPLMHTWTLWFTKPPSGKVGSLPVSETNLFNIRFRVTTGMTS